MNILSAVLSILAVAVPVIVGAAAPVIAKAFAALNADIGKLPHTLQLFVVAVVGAVLGVVAQLIGIPMPNDLAKFDPNTVGTLLNAGLTAAIGVLSHLVTIKTQAAASGK